MRKQIIILVVCVCVAVSISCMTVLAKEGNGKEDGESPMDWDKLPLAVQEAITVQLGAERPETITRETDDDLMIYEAAQKVNGRLKEVKVGDNGQVIEVEDTLSVSDLPAVVTATVQKEAPEAQIEEVCLVTYYYYEIMVNKEGEKREVKVLGNGQILEEED